MGRIVYSIMNTGILGLIALATSSGFTIQGNLNAIGTPSGMSPERTASSYSGVDACARVQAAHDALPSGGGTIIADFEGTQDCTTTIAITKPVILRGLGTRATKLNYTPTSGTALTVKVPMTPGGGSDGVELIDFYLQGPGTGTGDGIHVLSSLRFGIHRVMVDGFGNDGVVITGDGKTNSDLSLLDNVASYRNGRYGVYLQGVDANLIKFLGGDYSQNAIGIRVETISNIFLGAHTDDNKVAAVQFGAGARFNYGYIYAERQAGNDIYFEAGSGYNEIYNVAAGPNEVHPFHNQSTALGSALNGTLYRHPIFKNLPAATGSASAMFHDGVFSDERGASNSGAHIGVAGLVSLRAPNTTNFTGSLEAIRSTVQTASGASGTVSNLYNIRTQTSLDGGHVTNWYGLRITAPTGSISPVNKYSFFADRGAGKAVVRDSINPGTVKFEDLPASPVNGDIIYCENCTKTTPCGSGGSGAMAKRINGAWDCD